jgi:predicted Zn-dependent protease
VIHELTHAIGFSGHFRKQSFQRRSVLYYAGTVTNWSQADAAAIRIMYSSNMKNGMDVQDVNKALRRYAAGKR